MNKIQLGLTAFGISLLFASATLIKTHHVANPAFVKFSQERGRQEAQEIKGAREYFRQLTANQITGEVNYADVQAAHNQANALLKNSAKHSRAFLNMKWEETGPNNVGGRTRILLVDKNNSNKIYMGAVGGGFWISNDNGNSWTKRSGNDTTGAIAVCAIAQAANGDIYYGTGEGQGGWAGSSFVEQLFQLGEGIFKSTDGGATFTQLASTKPANSNSASDPWSYVDKLVADPVNPDKIFAATYGGLKVTTNGGTSWAKPTGLNLNTHFLDVEISSNGNRVVACTGSNVYISNDGGTSFGGNVMGTGGLPASSTASRIEIAIAPSDPNYVYLAIAATNESLKGVYRSTDGGASWTAIGLGGSAIFNPFGNQGVYDIAFAVHPTKKDMVYLGGQLEMKRYSNSTGWESIAFWQGNTGKLIHADMHCVAFNPSDPETMYVTTDGGMYRTFNSSDASPVFAEKNKNYSVTQCYGVAANYLGRVVFGSQDNGSGLMGESANSPQDSRDLTGGDGTRCAMSDYMPNFIFTSIVNGELRRAADGGQSSASFKSIFDKNIDLNTNGSSGSSPDGAPDEGGLWVTPIEYKEKKVGNEIKSVMLFGTNSSVWMTQGALKGNAVWFRLYSPGSVGFSALSLSKDGKTVFAATNSGTLYRISVPSLWDSTYKYTDTVANMPPKVGGVAGPYTYPLYSACQASNIGSFSGRFITDLSCDSTGDVLLVTLANYGNTSYIYKSTDAISSVSPTFTDITSNLPKMPLYSSLCLWGSPTKFMIGTELGIWGTENGGNSWTELNMMNSDPATWHPRVAVYEIAEKDLYENASSVGDGYHGPVIYTGSHGRGTFRSTSLAQYFPTAASYIGEHTGTITVYPNPVQDQVNISYDAEANSSAVICIYSLTGTLIRNERVNITEGKNVLSLNLSNLVSGGYIVYLNDHGKKASTTFIKQ